MRRLRSFVLAATLLVQWTNPQIHKSTNPQIHKSTNPQIHKSTNPQIHKSTNPQIHKSTNPQIHKSTNPQIHKSTNPQIHKSTNQTSTQQSNNLQQLFTFPPSSLGVIEMGFHVVGLEAASSAKTCFLLQSTCAKASCQSLIFFLITRVTHNVVSFSGFLSDIWFGSFGLGINGLLPGHGGRPQLVGMWLPLFAFLLFSSITLRIRL